MIIIFSITILVTGSTGCVQSRSCAIIDDEEGEEEGEEEEGCQDYA